jgi:hypothetical protein
VVGEPFICCPTHGRAGRVRVLRVIPDIPLIVAESQAPLYEPLYPDNELVVHPDSIKGIGPKRQWLMERYGEVFMLDDDVTAMVDLGAEPGEVNKVSGDAARGIIGRLFDQARQMDAYLVGFAPHADPTMYRPQNPFHLTGFVSGYAMGLRAGGELWFPNDVRMITDDLYVSALNAHHHRFCLVDMRYAFHSPGTWENPGGMSLHRTWERILENNEMMIDLFGRDAIAYKTGTFKAGLTHEAQIALKIPW